MKTAVTTLCCALTLASAHAVADCRDLQAPYAQGAPFDVDVTENVSYRLLDPADYPDPELYAEMQARHRLDVYRPHGVIGNKVVLFIPGGGWVQGDKSTYTAVGRTLASYYGLTTVIANYELSGPGGTDQHPAHVADVAAAFAWIKNPGDDELPNIVGYGGDPEAVYLFGQSAGGHLVALLATDPQYLGEEGYSPADLSGVVAMSGMYELPTLVQYPNALGLGQGDVVLYRGMLATAFGSTRYADLAPPSPQLRLGGYRMPMRVIYSDGDVPGLEQEAAMYVQVAQGIDPSVPIDLCGIAYEDYDPTTWEQAISLAADTEVLGVPLLAGAPGHFAEVLAIRPEEPDSYPTRLVVDFINRH